MKVVVVSHSGIHPRQWRFWHFMRNEGVDILEIYPARWGTQTREGGYEIIGSNMDEFIFSSEALEAIQKFQPDSL